MDLCLHGYPHTRERHVRGACDDAPASSAIVTGSGKKPLTSIHPTTSLRSATLAHPLRDTHAPDARTSFGSVFGVLRIDSHDLSPEVR